ncbi:MAG: Zeta toxin family protein [Gammaproteobacteria bacterium]|nr:Zeta toxin family protein [Gammaproteobacteria bacterium]
MPHIFIIAGPNGAGKTTAAQSLFPELLQCDEYVNADSIAVALSPFHPETTAFQAGRLMLERIRFLAEQKKSFAFETTLASRTFAPLLRGWQKNKSYLVSILFLWLPTIKMSEVRIKKRVDSGGHDIPKLVIHRRYHRSIRNFLNLYSVLADNWFLYDNSDIYPRMIARKSKKTELIIYEPITWRKIIE